MQKVYNESREKKVYFVCFVYFFSSSILLGFVGSFEHDKHSHTHAYIRASQVDGNKCVVSALLQIGYAILTLHRNLLHWENSNEKCI